MDNQQPSINTKIFTQLPKRNHGFIYMYTSPSGKKYIGQTVQSLKQRARNGKGYKNCGLFYKAIQKYGFENFQVQILEEAPINLLDEKEKEWISFLNTQRPNGYNLAVGGESGNIKEVHQYNAQTGEYVQSYSSLTEAANLNNIKDIQYISNCLHNKQKSCNGYRWSFEKVSNVDSVQYYKNTPREVYAYNLDGSFYKKFDSIAAAAKQVGCNRCDIKKNIENKIKFCKGYIWTDTYKTAVLPIKTGKNGSIPVKQIDIETGKVINIFGSQSEAKRVLGIKSNGIANCCKGKAKTCGGYRWEIYEGSTTISPQNPEE